MYIRPQQFQIVLASMQALTVVPSESENLLASLKTHWAKRLKRRSIDRNEKKDCRMLLFCISVQLNDIHKCLIGRRAVCGVRNDLSVPPLIASNDIAADNNEKLAKHHVGGHDV